MNRSSANLLLLMASAIWGTTFVAQRIGMADVGPFTFTGARFLMGAVFILPFARREETRLSRSNIFLDRRDFIVWSALGLLLFLGASFQQIGLVTTTVTNSGFLTSLYVPLVPFFAWLIQRQRPHCFVWPGVLCSLSGTWLLSGGELSRFNAGDIWTMASTVFWAAHVLWVGQVAAHKNSPILVAFWQSIVCGMLALSVASVTEDSFSTSAMLTALPTILYAGFLSVGIAFTMQVVAQSHTRAADAAILLSSETVFAAIAGAIYLEERLTGIQVLGCALMLFSAVVVQVGPLWTRSEGAIAPLSRSRERGRGEGA